MKTRYLFIYLLFSLYFILSVHSLCSDDERIALNNFANSFTFFKNKWDENLDCCDRSGIRCDSSNTTIVEISLFDYSSYGDSIVMDFTALNSLKILWFSAGNVGNNPSSIIDLRLPNSIEQINMDSLLLDSSSQYALLPSLTFLSIRPSSKFDFNVAHEMPKLMTLQLNVMQDYLGLNEKYTNLQVVSFQPSSTPSFDNIYLEFCNLPKFSGLYQYNQIGITWPSCFSNINFFSFQSYAFFNNLNEFPTFADSIIEFAYQRGDNEPLTLPKKLPLSVETLTLVGYEGTIPSEWEVLTNLTEVDLTDNALSGEIPIFLIKQLFDFKGEGLEFSNNANDFLHVRPNSNWQVANNLFTGPISDDFKYLVNNTFVDFRNCQSLKGSVLSWYVYCSPALNFFSVADLILQGETMSKNSKQFNFCYDFYQKTVSEEIPLRGGTFKINYPYAAIGNEAILQAVLPENLKKTSGKQQKLFLRNDNQDKLSSNSEFDPLPPPPPQDFFDPYEYFENEVGLVSIRGRDGDVLIKCKLITWEGELECTVLDSSEYDVDLSSPIELRYYSVSREDETLITKTIFLDAPQVDNISSDLLTNKGGYLNINGNYFGGVSSRSKVELVSEGNPSIDCTIVERNNTNILCRTAKLPENGNIVYNVVVQINDQVNQNQVTLTFGQPEVASNCYGGESDVICSGQGQCIEGKRCECNKGYRGVFCEIKDTEVSVTTPTKPDATPDSNFTNPESTTDFHVSVKEIREIDNRNRIVRTITPSWTNQPSSGASEFIFTSDIDDGKVRVTMNIFTEASVVEFANTTIQTEPGAIKYTVQIDKFPFKSSLNQLGVVFNIEALPSQAVVDNCAPLNNTKLEQDPNLSDIQWIQMTRGNSRMIGKVLNRALIDSRIVYITFESEAIGANSINLIGYVPFFTNTMVLDPNFSVLLETDSESTVPTDNQCGSQKKKDKKTWAIATAVSISGAFAIGAIVVAIVFYKKHQSDIELKKNIEQRMQDLNKDNNKL